MFTCNVSLVFYLYFKVDIMKVISYTDVLDKSERVLKVMLARPFNSEVVLPKYDVYRKQVKHEPLRVLKKFKTEISRKSHFIGTEMKRRGTWSLKLFLLFCPLLAE